jgi:hypothetical protein
MCAVVVGLVLLVVVGRGQADDTKLRNTTRSALQQGGEGVPLGTGVTYQGRLQDSDGNPITDTCDLRFSLWDAESDGSRIGSDCALTEAPVTAGYFTATINADYEFGSDALLGGARWLQVAVR